ncbi:MAG: enoyl-CoA hydratase/isomerase family protein [Alphaproteobacteria bacterium]|nr:enoyl-CoA hydratase/isomerase family protein [Alphaproteobacteria bacterium]
MSEAEDVVLLNTTRAGVAVVTLNRPKVHNAFNPEVIERLSDIFETLRSADGVRVVLVEGAGPSFSAGADLAWMRAAADLTERDNREDAGGMGEMLRRLSTLPQVTIALVHGAAMAGGCGILSACDIAIATKGASFALSEVRLGIIPAVISPYVIRAIGARAAHRYFLTAERFDAATAHALGLVHIVVEDNNTLAKEVERMVQQIFTCAPGAINAAKELIAAVAGRPIDSHIIADTSRRIAEQRSTAEAKEGLSAFLEKRKPKWAE